MPLKVKHRGFDLHPSQLDYLKGEREKEKERERERESGEEESRRKKRFKGETITRGLIKGLRRILRATKAGNAPYRRNNRHLTRESIFQSITRRDAALVESHSRLAATHRRYRASVSFGVDSRGRRI